MSERAPRVAAAARRHVGADARYYRVADKGSNVELVDWGPTGPTRPNAWVTLHAMVVLRGAGRLENLGRRVIR